MTQISQVFRSGVFACLSVSVLLAAACGGEEPPAAGDSGANGSPITSPGNSSPGPDSGEPTTGDTGSFAIPDPGDSGVAGPECDPWLQDCPRGKKCVPYADDGGDSWNNLKCAEIRGDDKVGEPCVYTNPDSTDGLDSCAKGSICLNNICVQQCQGSESEPICPEAQACSILNYGVLTICVSTCNPLLQDCPQEGEACYSDAEDFKCFQDSSGAAGAAFDDCGFANDCDPGLICLPPEVTAEECKGPSGCCTPFCDTAAENTCPGKGQECVVFFPPNEGPEGFENVGVCGLPL